MSVDPTFEPSAAAEAAPDAGDLYAAVGEPTLGSVLVTEMPKQKLRLEMLVARGDVDEARAVYDYLHQWTSEQSGALLEVSQTRTSDPAVALMRERAASLLRGTFIDPDTVRNLDPRVNKNSDQFFMAATGASVDVAKLRRRVMYDASSTGFEAKLFHEANNLAATYSAKVAGQGKHGTYRASGANQLVQLGHAMRSRLVAKYGDGTDADIPADLVHVAKLALQSGATDKVRNDTIQGFLDLAEGTALPNGVLDGTPDARRYRMGLVASAAQGVAATEDQVPTGPDGEPGVPVRDTLASGFLPELLRVYKTSVRMRGSTGATIIEDTKRAVVGLNQQMAALGNYPATPEELPFLMRGAIRFAVGPNRIAALPAEETNRYSRYKDAGSFPEKEIMARHAAGLDNPIMTMVSKGALRNLSRVVQQWEARGSRFGDNPQVALASFLRKGTVPTNVNPLLHQELQDVLAWSIDCAAEMLQSNKPTLTRTEARAYAAASVHGVDPHAWAITPDVLRK